MEVDDQKAQHACISCKKQKRKCDKALPSCSLCVRVGRVCDYSEPPPPTHEDFFTLQNRIVELENRLSQSSQSPNSGSLTSGLTNGSLKTSSLTARAVTNNPSESFPALFFLDYDTFKEARISIPKPSPPIPEDIYAILGTLENIHDIANRYFSSVHRWLPIVSKKRLELALTSPDTDFPPELALLLVAMHLISAEHFSDSKTAQSSLYWTAKSYYSVLESHAVMSPLVLQAIILITAYEIGHAIYPAAYLSVGKCVAFGKAMGFDNRRTAPQMHGRYGAWAEAERQKRTWWAIMMLDRYVNIGIPGHALATEEPLTTDVLPAEDLLWDQGEMSSSEPLYVASPTNVPAGAFARTCQATNLLGKVVRSLTENLRESETRFETGVQLFRTLTAFQKVLLDPFESSPQQFSTALAFTYGSVLHLCEPYSCTETNRGAHTVAEAELQTISIHAMRDTAAEVLKFAQKLRFSMLMHPASISPFIADAIYMGSTTYMWLVHEMGTSEMVDAYRALRDTLNLINGRWAVGGEYIKVLDKAKEVLYGNNPLL